MAKIKYNEETFINEYFTDEMGKNIYLFEPALSIKFTSKGKPKVKAIKTKISRGNKRN